MKKSSYKFLAVVCVTLVGYIIISTVRDKRVLISKLSKCSSYTVANVTRVYRLSGMAHAEYKYKVGLNVVEADMAVNNFDTGESWYVNMDDLAKRRLLVQVDCGNISTHQIVWDVPVPDTLRDIPVGGWKEVPFKLY